MNVIAFGCSFTFGEELDDLPEFYNDKSDERNYMPLKLKYHRPSKKSYPYIMGSLLGCDVKNYGWSGGSNDRIFRTFFDHILNNKKKSIYVIQWTFPHRSEIWSNESQFYVGIVPSLIDRNEDTKRFYKDCYDENDVRDKLLRYIWSVDSVCKEFNHKILQFLPIGGDNMGWDGDNLDSKCPLFNNLPNSFLNTKVVREKVDYKMHPTEHGHKKLAEYLSKGI